MIGDGIFIHECNRPGCGRRVAFDDQPWCSTHYPDKDSSVAGYSARKSAARATVLRSSSHKYISTACHHKLHTNCRMICKFCESKCACLCHNREETND